MRLTNILERRLLDVSQSPNSPTQLNIDSALYSAQAFAGDARFIALAFVAPLALSRLSGVWRNLNTARAIAQSEVALSSVPSVSLFARTPWSLRGLSAFATGALLVGCGTEENPVDDAHLQPPRALEAQATEFNVTGETSLGTNTGFHASLNEPGSLAVTWADYNPSNANPSAVLMRIFPAMGSPSNVVEVARPEAATVLAPYVSNADNGDTLLAWTHSLGVDSPNGVRARRYTGGAQAQGDSFNIVPLEMRDPVIAGTVALNPDGSFIVVSNENSASCGVCARNYSADNAQQSVTTLSAPGEQVLSSDISASSQGEWAWAGMVDLGNDRREIRFRAYVPGRNFGAPGTLAVSNLESVSNIQLALIPGNHSLIVWQSSQGLRGQLFTSNGNRVGSTLNINSLPPGSNFSVASDETGAFVVAWEDQGQIRASLLAADGRAIASNLEISGAGGGNSNVTVAANEHGRVSFVWRKFQERPAGYNLVARSFQIRY